MKSASPVSPSWISTVFFGNVRTTPVSAIARSVASSSGEKGSCGIGGAVTVGKVPDGQSRILIDFAPVLDHLAVVGQRAGRVEVHLAAQLGQVPDRRDDR